MYQLDILCLLQYLCINLLFSCHLKFPPTFAQHCTSSTNNCKSRASPGRDLRSSVHCQPKVPAYPRCLPKGAWHAFCFSSYFLIGFPASLFPGYPGLRTNQPLSQGTGLPQRLLPGFLCPIFLIYHRHRKGSRCPLFDR
jgi:hypothetical protein